MFIQYPAISTNMQEPGAWRGLPEAQDREQTETTGGASTLGVSLGDTAEPELRAPGMPGEVPIGTATWGLRVEEWGQGKGVHSQDSLSKGPASYFIKSLLLAG